MPLLLRRQLEVTGCDLVRPTITIVKNAQGKYNFQSVLNGLKGDREHLSVCIAFKLSEGTLAYLDQGTGERPN